MRSRLLQAIEDELELQDLAASRNYKEDLGKLREAGPAQEEFAAVVRSPVMRSPVTRSRLFQAVEGDQELRASAASRNYEDTMRSEEDLGKLNEAGPAQGEFAAVWGQGNTRLHSW